MRRAILGDETSNWVSPQARAVQQVTAAEPSTLIATLTAARYALLAGAENLHPAYFALVMATGIIAIAINALLSPEIARVLYWLNAFFYLCLWTLTATRIVLFRQRFLTDLSSHQLGPGFFTLAAASGVMGSGTILIMGNFTAAVVLWAITLLLWLCLTYAIFVGLIIKEDKPTIADGINGGWLTAIVATQSVASLTALLSGRFGVHQQEMLFFALALWLFGGMLYIWVISLIFYRYTFFKFAPQDLAPPYWINMGAVAISTMAGAILISQANASPLLTAILPFLKGFSLLFWATGTWWIPMLVILGIWRHIYKKYPIEYHCLYWGAVFPLGMYTVATNLLAQANSLPFLSVIPKYFIFIAITAWTITSVGLLKTILRKVTAVLQVDNRTQRRVSYSGIVVAARDASK